LGTDDQLLDAVEQGEIEKIEKLLDKGANPNVQDIFGSTPLRIAARCDNPEVVELLLKRGADPNVPDIFGSTPLHIAAECDNPEVVELLLKRGADPNIPDDDGQTALHKAAGEKVVQLLVGFKTDTESVS
jgi:ankyrin repeat protein